MILLLAFAATLLLLDQTSKRAVRSCGPDRVIFGSFLRIRYFRNLNRIYASRHGRTALALIWLIAFLSAILLRGYGGWFQSPLAEIGLGLALGGAAGNLSDILLHQYVVDFIDFGWWPIFNFADVGIVGGLALAFWH